MHGKNDQLLKEIQAPQHAKVVRVNRLSPGPHTSFPRVKVEFESNKVREKVLRCGRNLKVSINFRGVSVHASKSQSERQAINNFCSLFMLIRGVREQVHMNHNARVLPNRTSVTQFNQHNQVHSTKAWSNGPHRHKQLHLLICKTTQQDQANRIFFLNTTIKV